MTCPRHWELRAIDEARLAPGDITAFHRHTVTCVECHRELEALRKLHALTTALPVHVSGPLDARRLRARILRDAMAAPPRGRSRRIPFFVAATVLAATLLMVLAVRLRLPTNTSMAGTIQPAPGAVWEQRREADIERVFLNSGELTIRVRKQTRGERFLVVLPDGEAEVRGTVFEVSVRGATTKLVHVDEGTVVVRVHGATTLTAGQTWSSEAEAPADGTPVRTPAPSVGDGPSLPSRSPSAGVAPAASSLPSLPASAHHPDAVKASLDSGTDEGAFVAYEHAMEAYSAKNFEEAVDMFHAFTLNHPTSSFLDDASFLEASSLAEAGRGDAAALLAERHLERFPTSFHRKDASILVARLRRNRGDCEGARKLLAPWMSDASTDRKVTAALGGCAL